MKQRKILPVLRSVLQIPVFWVLIGQILSGKIGYVYLCVLTLLLMELPGWVEHRLGVVLPDATEILLLLLVFSSEILGEIGRWYLRFPGWDALLHGVSGFLFGSVGFVFPDLIRGHGTGMDRRSRAVFSILFSVSVGVLWEFLEWGVDLAFGLDMQKDTVISALRSVCLGRGDAVGCVEDIRNTVLILGDGSVRIIEGYLDVGLHDTMGDLVADLAGAVLFAVMSGRKTFSDHFIPIIICSEER